MQVSRRAALILIIGGLVAACRTARPTEGTSADFPSTFSGSGVAILDRSWWEAFGDEGLNQMVRRALDKNFSLRAAASRIDQARAQATQAGVELYPALSAGVSAEGTRGSSQGVTQESRSYTLGLSASYEVDLWGKLRSYRDASQLDALATREDYQTAAISLSGSTVSLWTQLQEQTALRNVLREQRRTTADELVLILGRNRRGQVNASDVLQQEQLLESVDGDLELVEANIKVPWQRPCGAVG